MASRSPKPSAAAVRGAAAGVAATTAMSVFLLAAQRRGWLQKQPPRIIVEKLVPELSQRQERRAALIAHFGYGTGGGTAYGLLVRMLPANAATGAAFGLAVWAAGYEGWLPAMGVLPPAHRDKRSRALTMLAAHLVYGAVLGVASRRAR